VVSFSPAISKVPAEAATVSINTRASEAACFISGNLVLEFGFEKRSLFSANGGWVEDPP
jgi:hypothetical protein